MGKSTNYNLSYSEKTGYLHVVVTGRNSRENVAMYLADVLKECNKRNYPRVLIEERLHGPRLKLTDVFQIVSDAANSSDRTLKSIAYVDMNAEGDLMKFAETVAFNRSLPAQVFTTLEDAEKWLADRGPASSSFV